MIGQDIQTFKIRLDSDQFIKGDRVITSFQPKICLQVVSTPQRKWWHIIFKWITFGLFKPRWYYKVKIVE